jgi:glucoamylase
MDMMEDEAFEHWRERQLKASLRLMAQSISATSLTRERAEFFQEMTPKRGSVVAAPTVGAQERPDYFFHWLRDSAQVVDALALAIERGYEPEASRRHLRDFVEFSRKISRLDGRMRLATQGVGATSDPELARYLRNAHELEAIVGARARAEARVNPDGTLDILKWARPQYDGPALRALTLLRHMSLFEQDEPEAARELLAGDLDFVLRHADDPGYDLWEHRFGHHYHTRLVSLAALTRGAAWARENGRAEQAEEFEAATLQLRRRLDCHWSAADGYYCSAIKAASVPSDMDLDSAVVLAVVDAGLTEGRHSILDPRAQATLERLEELFVSLFPINQGLSPEQAPLLGRFRGDGYYGGGVWVMAAFAAAQVYYRLARHVGAVGTLRVETDNRRFLERVGLGRLLGRGPDATLAPGAERGETAELLRKRGDTILMAVAGHTPPDGELSEQLDKATGEPASARNLAWSYAAFIGAVAAREQSLEAG